MPLDVEACRFASGMIKLEDVRRLDNSLLSTHCRRWAELEADIETDRSCRTGPANEARLPDNGTTRTARKIGIPDWLHLSLARITNLGRAG